MTRRRRRRPAMKRSPIISIVGGTRARRARLRTADRVRRRSSPRSAILILPRYRTRLVSIRERHQVGRYASTVAPVAADRRTTGRISCVVRVGLEDGSLDTSSESRRSRARCRRDSMPPDSSAVNSPAAREPDGAQAIRDVLAIASRKSPPARAKTQVALDVRNRRARSSEQHTDALTQVASSPRHVDDVSRDSDLPARVLEPHTSLQMTLCRSPDQLSRAACRPRPRANSSSTTRVP